jgi:hypothetical protein
MLRLFERFITVICLHQPGQHPVITQQSGLFNYLWLLAGYLLIQPYNSWSSHSKVIHIILGLRDISVMKVN